jgi:hypothetical protein
MLLSPLAIACNIYQLLVHLVATSGKKVRCRLSDSTEKIIARDNIRTYQYYKQIVSSVDYIKIALGNVWVVT